MARLLGHDAYLVSYGAMSKQPLSLPTSLFIFKNLTTAGFWQSRWYKTHTRDDKENLMKTLVDLVAQGKVRESLTCKRTSQTGISSSKHQNTRYSPYLLKIRTKSQDRRSETSWPKFHRANTERRCYSKLRALNKRSGCIALHTSSYRILRSSKNR